MKKIADYLQHAAECRETARIATASQRQQLEGMAATWEQLAAVRKVQLEKNGVSETDAK
jgi:hypothetical protein